MADKLPWMPFYGRDFYGDERVLPLTQDQRAIYIRLLWHQWEHDSIPDLEECSQWAEFQGCKVSVELIHGRFFRPHKTHQGRFFNSRLAEIKREQIEYLTSRSEAASHAAAMRWQCDGIPLAMRSQSDCNAKDKVKVKDKEKRREEPDTSTGKELALRPSPSGFDRFWDAYPRKIGKGAALKAWERVKPTSELIETILSQIEAAKKTEQWTRDSGQFIPHPSTWLNQSRWEDDYKTPAPTPSGFLGRMEKLSRGERL